MRKNKNCSGLIGATLIIGFMLAASAVTARSAGLEIKDSVLSEYRGKAGLQTEVTL
jgi:hypothetical protein